MTSSNFDSIKEELAAAIAVALGVDSSIVSLTLSPIALLHINSYNLRSSSIVVVVSITTSDQDVAYSLQDNINANSFVTDVNTAVNSSPLLAEARVVLDDVDAAKCGGCGM